jgi:hypothetical protein
MVNDTDTVTVLFAPAHQIVYVANWAANKQGSPAMRREGLRMRWSATERAGLAISPQNACAV